MAGIGFELNKLLSKNSFFSDIFSFFYSANVSAGPWIMSSVTLVVIQLLIPQNEIPFFISAIIYTFIFSTIIFGSVSTSVTRFLADLIYKKEFEKIYGLYISSLGYAVFSSATFLTIFFLINKITELWKIFLFSYSLTILTIIWVQVIFITAIRVLLLLYSVFIRKSAESVWKRLSFKFRGEYFSYLGYNFGLMFIASMLQLFIRRYLFVVKPSKETKLLFLEAVKKYKKQAVSGFITYMAAWIDDFIAWSYFKYSISKGFIFAPQYDIPMFISYLFIVPTLTLFVLNLETDFYFNYRAFYQSIEENRTLTYIKLAKETLDNNLYATTKLILSVQFTFMLSGLILSGPLAKALILNDYGLKALRFGIVGAAANGIFLYVSLIAHYFDLPDIPMYASIIAFTINFVFSMLTIIRFPGIGFAIGFIIAVIYSWTKFRAVYKDLLHFEFIRNRLSLPLRQVIIHENKYFEETE